MYLLCSSVSVSTRNCCSKYSATCAFHSWWWYRRCAPTFSVATVRSGTTETSSASSKLTSLPPKNWADSFRSHRGLTTFGNSNRYTRAKTYSFVEKSRDTVIQNQAQSGQRYAKHWRHARTLLSQPKTGTKWVHLPPRQSPRRGCQLFLQVPQSNRVGQVLDAEGVCLHRQVQRTHPTHHHSQ